jgi:hypothetical protein
MRNKKVIDENGKKYKKKEDTNEDIKGEKGRDKNKARTNDPAKERVKE